MVKSTKSKIQKMRRNHPKQILVPIDFSPASREALTQALGLAGDTTRIILLHVIAPSANEDLDLSQSIEAAEHKLVQFTKSDGVNAPELIRFEVRTGTLFREIIQCAEENEVEMIVLAVHDLSPFGRLSLPHTVDRVSRYAPCPVLLVREQDVDLAAKKRNELRANIAA